MINNIQLTKLEKQICNHIKYQKKDFSMQNNITVRIALCGLLVTTQVTMTMESEATEFKTLMLSSQSGRISNVPQISPNNSQSGSQPSSPLKLSSNKLSDAPIKEESTLKGLSLNPTPKNSPLNRSNNEIPHTHSPSIQRSNSQTSFTNTPQKNVQCYRCINSKDIGNNQSEITYINDLNEEITKILPIKKTYNEERFLAVIEDNQGVVEKYAIDLKGDSSDINLKNEEQNKPNLSGCLTSNFRPSNMPNTTTIYEGIKAQKIDNQTLEITYIDENKKAQTIQVSNTTTDKKPTYAIITNRDFAIDLQNIKTEGEIINPKKETPINPDISQKSFSLKKPMSHKNNKNPRYIFGGLAFVTAIILIAYKYNQLPTAFEKALNQFFAMFTSIGIIR